MPSNSAQQRKYIFYLRGKYKNKTNTPEKLKWIWNEGWKDIKERYTSYYNKENKDSEEKKL